MNQLCLILAIIQLVSANSTSTTIGTTVTAIGTTSTTAGTTSTIVGTSTTPGTTATTPGTTATTPGTTATTPGTTATTPGTTTTTPGATSTTPSTTTTTPSTTTTTPSTTTTTPSTTTTTPSTTTTTPSTTTTTPSTTTTTPSTTTTTPSTTTTTPSTTTTTPSTTTTTPSTTTTTPGTTTTTPSTTTTTPNTTTTTPSTTTTTPGTTTTTPSTTTTTPSTTTTTPGTTTTTVGATITTPSTTGTTIGAPVSICPSGQSWCVTFYSTAMTFCNAVKTCHSNGQEMITKSVFDAMRNYSAILSGTSSFWVGLVDALNERGSNRDGWVWIKDGQVTTGTENYFGTGQPSGASRQDCVAASSSSMQLMDMLCSNFSQFYCYSDIPVVKPSPIMSRSFNKVEIRVDNQPDPGCWMTQSNTPTLWHCTIACFKFEFGDCVGFYWHGIRRECVLMPFFDAAVPLANMSSSVMELMQWTKYIRSNA